MNYDPTFVQPVKGVYQDNTSIQTLVVGSGAYVTEREMNELQWLRSEEVANVVREITSSGVFSSTLDSTMSKCFQVVDIGVDHPNSLAITPFKAVVDGRLVRCESVSKGKHSANTVRLPNPPVSNTRYDFIYLECWFAELKGTDAVVEYGGVANDALAYSIIDERVEAETSRRIQLQWRIAVYEDYDGYCGTGFLDSTGKPNPKIYPLAGTSLATNAFTFDRSAHDANLFVAGDGLSTSKRIDTADGYVYALPLLLVTRINNSGYDALNNPTGGVDYVNAQTVCDRPDGRFSNVIYADQVRSLATTSAVGSSQFDALYVTLAKYSDDAKVLRDKVKAMTYDLENANNVFKSIGYILPAKHDKEIYGLEMFRQYAHTAGAMFDGDKRQVVYKRRRYSVGRNLSGVNYAVVPSLVDYDYDTIGDLGDLYVTKDRSKFSLYNTGGRGLKLDVTALFVDGVTVFAGEGLFFGTDGAVVTLPFAFNADRHFVHICALEDTNGRNGEVYVKAVGNDLVVYNTGATTNKRGKVAYTTNNRFQWVIIDTYSTMLKNAGMYHVKLAGQTGAVVEDAAFGEDYRLMVGTPVYDSATAVLDGDIGEVYADTEEQNKITVYNTGAATTSVPVQCLVFNDVPVSEYYDTLDQTNTTTTKIVNTPGVSSDLQKALDAITAINANMNNLGAQVSLTRSEVDAIAGDSLDRVDFTIADGATFTYALTGKGVSPDMFKSLSTVLVLDQIVGSPTLGQYVNAAAITEFAIANDAKSATIKNVSGDKQSFILIVK